MDRTVAQLEGAPPTAPGGETPSDAIVDRIRAVGVELARSLGAVLSALPVGARRPAGLVRELGVNRAVASRVLSATASSDPLEVVHGIPGPEPLRQLVRAAATRTVDAGLIDEAESAIGRFDELIRTEAGTRSGLDALISSSLPEAREKFELASKYSIFKGISQLKGARAETWLGTAVVCPAAEDPNRLDLTWLNGAVAMQRLRPGVTVRFSYRYRTGGQPGAVEEPLDDDLMTLDEFCTNPPARLETHRSGASDISFVLPPDLLGPRAVTDVFVVDTHPSAMRRYARHDRGSDHRHRTSIFVEPALPVTMLLFDVLIHEDVFPASAPQLVTYDTGYDGIADVNDATRDIDRMDVQESIEFLGHDLRTVYAQEVPRYTEMLAHLCDTLGWDPARFRGYRTRIQYPVYGWQICMTFEQPSAP